MTPLVLYVIYFGRAWKDNKKTGYNWKLTSKFIILKSSKLIIENILQKQNNNI